MKFENKEKVMPGFFIAVIIVIALGIMGVISNGVEGPSQCEELFQERPTFNIEDYKALFSDK